MTKNIRKVTRTKGNVNKRDVVDDRFAVVASRPQFQQRREPSCKVVLDDRFASVLTDPRFHVEEKDKYGRRKKEKQHSDAQDELGAFYTIEKKELSKPTQTSSDDDESCTSSSSSADSDEENDDMEPQDPASRITYLTALSRGEISVSSSSDEQDPDSSDDEPDDSDDEDDVSAAGILDPSAKEKEDEVTFTEEPSPYIAVMNMDWGHVRAVDLFAIIASFTVPGSVKRVQVFPSDFGMKRMANENQYGPSGLWKHESNEPEQDDSVDVDNERRKNETANDVRDDIQLENDTNPNSIDSGFDPEKLRAYEASKFRYYFAVVEFASPEHADVAYREVDGLELEHSSAAIDLRSIAPGDFERVCQGRALRDEATAVPSNYSLPDFVVSALQQTSVHCTWDEGNVERARKLTGYRRKDAGEWSTLAEEDDLRAYLASDVSSDEECDSNSNKEGNAKGARMRKMLGLDSDSDSDDASDAKYSSEVDSSSDSNYDERLSKVATFVPGKRNLEDKIRAKLQSKKEERQELTPWQKYQEKRKEKKKERRQASRNRRSPSGGNEVNRLSRPEFDVSMSIVDHTTGDTCDDKISLEETGEMRENHKTAKSSVVEEETVKKAPGTKEELELLLAGDKDEEATKDYDMRGLVRIAKNKGKKLHGSRKRKEAEAVVNISGADFRLDMGDERFAAVLDGSDDRFGIDRTDPNFKETAAMKEILSVQTKRRKSKKSKPAEPVVPDVTIDSTGSFGKATGGAVALSSLVKSLKSKVNKSVQ